VIHKLCSLYPSIKPETSSIKFAKNIGHLANDSKLFDVIIVMEHFGSFYALFSMLNFIYTDLYE
jgi:hypothetical protein